MIAVLRTHLIQRLSWLSGHSVGKKFNIAFQNTDFTHFFDPLTQYIIPDYRRQRPYISAILAKNDVNRDDKYNNKLFVRVQTRMYFPNPLVEILIDEEWLNAYDLIDIDGIEKEHAKKGPGFIGMIKNYRKQLTQNPNGKIDPTKYWKTIPPTKR